MTTPLGVRRSGFAVFMTFAVSAGLMNAAAQEGPTDAPKQAAPDFQADVMPVLQKYCIGCHNPDDIQSGLRLDEHALILNGGKRGASVIPGDAEKSLLVSMTEGRVKPRMPPKNQPAPKPAEVHILRRWVAGGAKISSGPVMKTRLPALRPSRPPVEVHQALAWSPAGKVLALAGYRRVRLVDPTTGIVNREFGGLEGAVTALSFSADGGLLAAAAGEPGRFGQAIVWNVADGKRVSEARGHRDSLHAVALSPDGRVLATAGYDKDVILWDATTAKPLHTLTGHNDAVYALAFRPDGKVLASASGDRTVKLWNVADGARLDTLSESLKELHAVSFSRDGARLYSAGVDNRIRAYSVSPTAKEGTNKLVHSRFGHNAPILGLTHARGEDLLISFATDRKVKLWQPGELTEIRLLELQPAWPLAATLAPDAAAMVVSRRDGSLATYDRKTGAKVADLVPKTPPPPKPEITSSSPRTLERGKPTRINVLGKHLANAEVTVSDPKVTATVEPGDTPDRLTLVVTAPADRPRGDISVTIKTAGGVTAARTIFVDDLPQLPVRDAGAALDTSAQAVPSLPITIDAEIRAPGDTDAFKVRVAKGRTVVCDLAAGSLGSKLNPTVTVADSSGKLLPVETDGTERDPVIVFTAPADADYTIRVADLEAAGSAEHRYRMSVGEFAWVAGVRPMIVPPNASSKVRLVGWNLPTGVDLTVTSGAVGMVAVPTAPGQRFRAAPQVRIGAADVVAEAEPNADPTSATRMPAPGTAVGVIEAPRDGVPDRDHFRFVSKKGESWILETEAGRLGSPADTRIDVLDASGRPVERVWLQAVRDSVIEFRNINSTQLEIRCLNWEEMELNELMYLRGEISRLFRMPQGPDSGFLFYAQNGRRRTYFDSTPTAHALADPVYIVRPHPPGTELVPNGLPTFRLHYANDDASDGSIGRDSRLTFTAPADGEYVVRIGDSRERGGDRFGYRLIVRRPEPDFSVSLVGVNPTVNRGSGRELTFVANRVDGFDGEIRVELTGLPPGFTISSPITIEAGHSEARAVLFARADAPEPTAANWASAKISASAVVDGEPVSKDVALSTRQAPTDPRSSRIRFPPKRSRTVNDLGKITLAPKPKLLVRMEPAEVAIEPGGTANVELIVERAGFNDKIQFAVDNLPHGVIVDNIGLNGILIPAGQSRRTMTLAARNWVGETSRPFFAIAQVEGNQASAPVTLHVRKPGKLAGR
jgi:hypothetical protein